MAEARTNSGHISTLSSMMQEADWKKEKHVPAIDSPAAVKKGELFKVTVSVGKEIAHPNTTEHHIAFIAAYFLPDGEKFPYQVGRAEFGAHGASTLGPNTSTVFTHPEVVFSMKTEKSGSIQAVSYCNIHGLWQSSKALEAR
jgi:superoxide reductase